MMIGCGPPPQAGAVGNYRGGSGSNGGVESW